MSVNSKMKYVDLQSFDEVQKPSGQFKEEWISKKKIYMAIFSREDRIYRSNTIELSEGTHIGITYTKGLVKGKNRIKVDDSIYNITSVNDDALRSVVVLKEVQPSGEL